MNVLWFWQDSETSFRYLHSLSAPSRVNKQMQQESRDQELEPLGCAVYGVMDSDTQERWLRAATGQLGAPAQLREYKRQLAYLPKWLQAQQRYVAKRRQMLRKKIKKLQHALTQHDYHPND